MISKFLDNLNHDITNIKKLITLKDQISVGINVLLECISILICCFSKDIMMLMTVCEQPARDIAELNQVHVFAGERDLDSTTEMNV
jgi:hypothetical protein